MCAEESSCLLEYTIVMLVIASDEEDMCEFFERFIDETPHPSALLDALPVGTLRIETSRVTEITCNDENIAAR
jgi:hypothetical protein